MEKHHVGFGLAAAFLLIAVVLGTAWMRSHDAKMRMEGDIRVHEQREKDNNEKIVANSNTVQAAQGTITAATASNTKIDAHHDENEKLIQAQLNSKPDTSQVMDMIQNALPGVKVSQGKDAQGNATLEVANTQDNRDAINRTDASFKSCRFDLDDCQQKQLNFQSIITAQTAQLTALTSTVAIQKESIDTLQKDLNREQSFGKGGNVWSRTGRVYLPLLCAGGGAWLASPKGPKAAAIGALAAGIPCSFVFHF